MGNGRPDYIMLKCVQRVPSAKDPNKKYSKEIGIAFLNKDAKDPKKFWINVKLHAFPIDGELTLYLMGEDKPEPKPEPKATETDDIPF